MNKALLILEHLELPNDYIFKDKVTLADLVAGLLEHSIANLVPILGMGRGTIERRIYTYLKPKLGSNSSSWRFQLLAVINEKYCSSCKEVYPKSHFYPDKSRSDGLCSICSLCKRANNSALRAKRSLRLPTWSEVDLIKEFYKSCPKDMAVDHIIPLCGELVSGLHVLSNLQYLSRIDNLTKTNTYKVE